MTRKIVKVNQGATVMILSFQTDMYWQIVKSLEKQSDQALHCLCFHLHLLDI